MFSNFLLDEFLLPLAQPCPNSYKMLFFFKNREIDTFMSPALLPNFCVNNCNESIVPLGCGAGLPISANASLIRAQSNLSILWPAQIRPIYNNVIFKNKLDYATHKVKLPGQVYIYINNCSSKTHSLQMILIQLLWPSLILEKPLPNKNPY